MISRNMMLVLVVSMIVVGCNNGTTEQDLDPSGSTILSDTQIQFVSQEIIFPKDGNVERRYQCVGTMCINITSSYTCQLIANKCLRFFAYFIKKYMDTHYAKLHYLKGSFLPSNNQ